MKFIAIIPARYASTRFPGKPLADMGGKPMIQRVYEQVKRAVHDVWVATDDSRIFETVKAFGGKAVMTSTDHRSGTDRIQEAYSKIGEDFDVVINVQGDEPFIQPEQIESLKECFDSKDVELATLVKPFKKEDGFDVLFNPNSPKVVINKESEAIYFSRSIVPYIRDAHHTEWLDKHTFYKHIGMYAYRVDVLKEITQLPQSSLEKAESLEQLRWIENGYRIRVGYTDVETIGIDTPEDMERAIKLLK
ncbi:MAG: 3-deoxy-manno-octulosonate cytidylyltransferase [Dysgonomonas mossii]|uniref:3-deoxy-manno-octulosonate cytidylyltransferase n=1 Tax=Dysgonomonas mossii TaxID=163665 RepID=UPI001DBEE8CF|nr:3-deoxy-manno-octulosonate cytidylyltransferase [Dysgonomonas mossii]MBS5796948.1 3-deoxy-manno-octulosonate cytidylyltransferase [Dysgonomonas mossii]MBS7111583.1 3-deoxy-manno-octulosonate cytidylyltransferase [Dysgonomonas mossii]